MTPEPEPPGQSLYALPPERFIAARNEAVARARAAGDAALAARLAALRRPTLAAWLVNLLANQRAEQLGELLDLGTELREAQRRLRGERLRELSARRRAAIAGLVAQVRPVAVAAGRRAGDPLPLAEVEATLAAAVADEELAEVVRAGRLTRATGYAGFGEPARPDLRVIEGGGRAAPTTASGRAARTGRPAGRTAAEPGEEAAPGAPAARAGTGAARSRAAAAGRAREEAAQAARTARIEAAEAGLRRAGADEQEAARVLAEISAEIDRLRERQAAAHAALREARLRRREAEREARRFGR